jgi:starch phosphorylase
MGLARDLVQGCDVWLNLPIPPQEASGTSGMKAAANGVLNASVLDGWWDEAYTPEAGWAIGRADVDDDRQRDASDAAAIYDLLEHTVAPLFYDVGAGETPVAWIRMARRSMALSLTGYSANRMVQNYVESFYGPAHLLGRSLSEHHGGAATDLAHWLDHVVAQWPHVRVLEVHADGPSQVDAGVVVPIQTHVALAGLSPDDVRVEVFVGHVDFEGTLIGGVAEVAEHASAESDGAHWFTGRAVLAQSGRLGIAVRVIPRHSLLAGPFDAGLIRWSEAAGAT